MTALTGRCPACGSAGTPLPPVTPEQAERNAAVLAEEADAYALAHPGEEPDDDEQETAA